MRAWEGAGEGVGARVGVKREINLHIADLSGRGHDAMESCGRFQVTFPEG